MQPNQKLALILAALSPEAPKYEEKETDFDYTNMLLVLKLAHTQISSTTEKLQGPTQTPFRPSCITLPIQKIKLGPNNWQAIKFSTELGKILSPLWAPLSRP